MENIKGIEFHAKQHRVCDCGDSTFWSEKGNCKNHKGTKVDSLPDMENTQL